MTSWELVVDTNISEKYTLFRPEDGDSTFFRNVCIYLQVHIASQLRTTTSTSSQPWQHTHKSTGLSCCERGLQGSCSTLCAARAKSCEDGSSRPATGFIISISRPPAPRVPFRGLVTRWKGQEQTRCEDILYLILAAVSLEVVVCNKRKSLLQGRLIELRNHRTEVCAVQVKCRNV
jgi:hypothetical protein